MARRTGKGDAPPVSHHRTPRFALALVLLLVLGVGCTFDGYVPKGKHKPVAEEERSIEDLAFGEAARGGLNCSEGRCRVRHRLRVDAAGHVDIVVDGPRGTPETPGPRLARVMLQDVNGRVVARNDVEQETGPMAFDADVSPGPYFVLIQGLGGQLEYTVTATYAASSGVAHGAASPPPTGADAGAAASEAVGASAETAPTGRAARAATAHSPGDTSDGADFAADPSADLLGMRRFAFAENPESQLSGEQAEGRGNPFVIRRVQREIRYALADAGVAQAEQRDTADYLVSVQIGSKATTWYTVSSMPRTTSYDAYFDRWRGMGAFINPHTYVDGTLVIDFIDPTSGELVWHGWTTEPVNVKLDDEEQLGRAVRAILAQIGVG